MPRYIAFICCLLSLSTLTALETSLVMSQVGNGGYVAMLNPTVGELRLYQVSGSTLRELNSVNVFTDLNLRANLPHPHVITYSRLRVGENTEPAYNDMLSGKMLPDKAREAGAPSMLLHAKRGEDDFWNEPPEYDGMIRGVFASRYLLLVVPSLRTIAVYTLENRQLLLSAHRNFGPDLYSPRGYNTRPDPQDLLHSLPQEQRDEWAERFDERLENLTINPDAGLELKDMDPWVTAPNQSTFVVLEPNNERLLVYRVENGTLVLRSSRNMEIDLMVPPEASYQTAPTPDEKYKAYLREMKNAKMVPDTINGLKARVQTAKLPGISKTEDAAIHADVDNDGHVVLDFTKKRKTMVYDPTSGGGIITLTAVRDYTLDAGIAIHLNDINRRNQGQAVYRQVRKMNLRSEERQTAAMAMLKMALRYNPKLYEDAEDERRLRALHEHEDWQSMIEQAMKASEEIEQREEQRRKLLEEMAEQQRR